MANKVLEGVQMDACLDQEQRHQFSKQLSSVFWMIKVEDSTTKQDKQDEGHVNVAGVCISPMGYILTSSHIIEPGMKYVGSCPSWKAGWTSLKVVKRSMAYGLTLFQVEGTSSKSADYTNLADTGVLRVNQHLYGFGHPEFFELSCVNTFVRGSVEYECEDVTELPPCVNDLDRSLAVSQEYIDGVENFDIQKAIAPSPRMVKHLKGVINLENFEPITILLMHEDIPLIQIKGFHLKYCGAPVFVSSGHVVGVVLFQLADINFAVHLSAIKEFLKGVDLSQAHVPAK